MLRPRRYSAPSGAAVVLIDSENMRTSLRSMNLPSDLNTIVTLAALATTGYEVLHTSRLFCPTRWRAPRVICSNGSTNGRCAIRRQSVFARRRNAVDWAMSDYLQRLEPSCSATLFICSGDGHFLNPLRHTEEDGQWQGIRVVSARRSLNQAYSRHGYTVIELDKLVPQL